MDALSSFRVQRLEEPTLWMNEELQENELYNGSANNLILSRTYKINLQCQFELQNYPFDFQKCFILVSDQSN